MLSTMQATSLSEKDLITSILNSFFIVDYGYINKVNADKTVNVTHAAKPVLMDGTELGETTTDNVEVLTISGAGFSINWDYKAKDKVLLLGLKDYVPKTENVTKAESPKAFVHYDRATLKAIPLCIFSDDAKVVIDIKNGTLKLDTEKKIELNGNTKQFVTYQELDNALQQLWAKIKAHTHPVSTTGTAAAQTGTAATSLDLSTVTLDISASKTTTVVTGG